MEERLSRRLLAKVSLGVGTGVLLYLSAARTSVQWSCLLVAAYMMALAVCQMQK